MENLLANFSGNKVVLRNGSFFALSILTFLAIKFSYKRNKLKLYFILFSVFGYIVIHLFLNANVRAWYFLPAYILFPYIVFQLKQSKLKFAFIIFQTLLIIGYLGLKASTTIKYIGNHTFEDSREFCEKVRNIVPHDEKIYQIMSSGYTGFFTGRHVINGDGLVNTYKYLSLKEENQLGDYLAKNDIKYLITNNGSPPPTISYCGLEIKKGDVTELLRSESTVEEVNFRLFVLKESYFENFKP